LRLPGCEVAVRGPAAAVVQAGLRARAGGWVARQCGASSRKSNLKEPAWRCHCSVPRWSCWLPLYNFGRCRAASWYLEIFVNQKREKNSTDNIKDSENVSSQATSCEVAPFFLYLVLRIFTRLETLQLCPLH
jgi:hypothetical protein